MDSITVFENGFLSKAHPVRYPRGSIIFVQRDIASRLFLILSGIVKLSIFTDQGDERIIEFIQPTRFLGAPDLFSGSLYGITAIAYTDVNAASFTIDQAKELSRKNPDFALQLVHSLSQHARALGRQLVGDTFFDATGRVAFALLSLAVQIGKNAGQDGAEIAITHQELARYVGCNRITVTNALTNLYREGLIARSKNPISIPSLTELRKWLDMEIRI